MGFLFPFDKPKRGLTVVRNTMYRGHLHITSANHTCKCPGHANTQQINPPTSPPPPRPPHQPHQPHQTPTPPAAPPPPPTPHCPGAQARALWRHAAQKHRRIFHLRFLFPAPEKPSDTTWERDRSCLEPKCAAVGM